MRLSKAQLSFSIKLVAPASSDWADTLYETPRFVVNFVGRDSFSTKLTIRLAIKML